MLYLITFCELFLFVFFIRILKNLFKNNNILANILCYGILILIAGILGGQIASIFHTGKYVETLTLANIQEVRAVGQKVFISSLLLVASTIVFSLIILSIKKELLQLLCFISLIVLLILNPRSAFNSFIQSGLSYFQECSFISNASLAEKQKKLYGKDNVYNNNFQIKDIMDLEGKNIVVIFAEGFALEWLSKYNNGKYKNLTPNLDRFLKNSVYFNNYYNHTAATFRGLRGQLTSSYQLKGGFTKNNDGLGQISEAGINQHLSSDLIGLPSVLRNNGYHTYFLSAHRNDTPLNWMLKTLNFNRIYGADDFHDSSESLTDQEIFSALADLVLGKEVQKPYFLGIYNIGTHLGRTSYRVKYLDGKNTLLNQIHDFDDAFGKFLKKVKDQKDLVIIFTADHTAFPSALYKETFTPRPYFVDTIPFAIWYQGIQPKVLDAKGRNSLDFAPTLLNALQINSVFNYFLGCSLFDQNCPHHFEHISNVGNFFIETPNMTPIKNEMKHQIQDFYHLSGQVHSKIKEKTK